MPTPGQIERAERARHDAMDASFGLPPFSDEEWEEHKTKARFRYPSDIAEMRAALLAAAPTSEEHARGIEAALAAYSGAMEENRYSMHTTIGMAIAAYVAAVGLTP